MKQIIFISGKGGTGKTVLTASVASLPKNQVLADCDVDAANLHLLFKPAIRETHTFISGKEAIIDRDICAECGECVSLCRYEAISRDFFIHSHKCEGCGLCSRICPAAAISMQEKVAGEWYVSKTDFGAFVHARLGIGADNSGKLVSRIKQKAKSLASEQKSDFLIIDGPPGIACPLIAAVSGVDLAVIVTEPTKSGIHDLERVLGITDHFKVNTGILINKSDLNPDYTDDIISLAEMNQIPFIGKIPYLPEVFEAVSQGMLPTSGNSTFLNCIQTVWEKIASLTKTKQIEAI